MSDESARAALRSTAKLVVVEAPAGCGKTYQGAEYARDIASLGEQRGRPLIVTHTHAACSVFAERTTGARSRVSIRTIDSVVTEIASAYHVGLGLPADVVAWVRRRGEGGHAELCMRVAKLLSVRPMIAATIARRHPIVICDEHQDSSGDQHAVIMALHRAGAQLRVFADPMQRIFRQRPVNGGFPPYDWNGFTGGGVHELLEQPHRWRGGSSELGAWMLKAREALKNRGRLDLRSGRIPEAVSVVYADNQANRHLAFALMSVERQPVDAFARGQQSLLVLTRSNETAASLRAFFNRRIPIWEGHVREGLDDLVAAVGAAAADPESLATAVVEFMARVGKGFSPSAFGRAFVDEASNGCTKRRTGKPALIQELARFIVDDPSHRGVANMLKRMWEFRQHEPAFGAVEIDNRNEFWDAIRLGEFETPELGLAEITSRRSYSRPRPPSRAISTIHKAKGIECEAVIVMPCDSRAFPARDDARCLLYVAISRATRNLLLVVSRDDPSPLIDM